jgi:hypothetical protein
VNGLVYLDIFAHNLGQDLTVPLVFLGWVGHETKPRLLQNDYVNFMRNSYSRQIGALEMCQPAQRCAERHGNARSCSARLAGGHAG